MRGRGLGGRGEATIAEAPGRKPPQATLQCSTGALLSPPAVRLLCGAIEDITDAVEQAARPDCKENYKWECDSHCLLPRGDKPPLLACLFQPRPSLLMHRQVEAA